MADIDLTAVLAEINRIRASVGRKPVARIEKGFPTWADTCPIALTIGGGACAWRSRISLTENVEIPTPKCIRDFIVAFDRGEFPQFERKGGK